MKFRSLLPPSIAAIGAVVFLVATVAQRVDADVVTNLSESYDVNFGTFGIFEQASSFTTGNQSYKLQSITMRVHIDNVGPQGIARLYSDALGEPGALVEQLSIVQPLTAGTQLAVFESSGSMLAANSQYWVSLSSTNNGAFFWAGTTSTNEFSLAGWTIGDQMKIRDVDDPAWGDVNFGPANESGLFSVQAVPEPSSFLICALAAVPMLMRRAKRKEVKT